MYLLTTNNLRSYFKKDFQAIKLCPRDYSGMSVAVVVVIVVVVRPTYGYQQVRVRRNVQCLLWKIVRKVETSPRVIPVMNVLWIQQWSAEAHCQHFRITFLLTPVIDRAHESASTISCRGEIFFYAQKTFGVEYLVITINSPV